MTQANFKHQPPLLSPIIGIDLATTFSVVGVWKNNTVEIFTNDVGNKSTPSYVAFTETERLVGDAAKNQAAMNPTNTIYDVKRLIGRKFSDPIVQQDMKLWPFKVVEGKGDKPLIEVEFQKTIKQYSAEELSAMILAKMKQIAETALGVPITRAVITCPAYFNDAQRQATKDAAIIAGLDPLRILNEPTAAALCYGLDKKTEEEKNILIYDLGGGTFDVSILTVAGGFFEVKATGGNTHLGGEDFDNALLQYCLDNIHSVHNINLYTNQRAIKRLKTACERCKRALSASYSSTIEVESLFDGKDFVLQISRAKFEEICDHWFKETLTSVEKVLADAKMYKKDIDEIVLVGGSTRIPRVQSLLSEFFKNKKLCQSVDPDLAVAWGAAVQAAVLSSNDNNNNDNNNDSNDNNGNSAVKDLVLVDVCPLSLGVELSGSIMHKLINRNTPIPTQQTQSFSTPSDNQTSVQVKIFEGERALTRDNHLLGTFLLSGIPPKPRGIPVIEITYDINSNGILTVTAVEKSTQNKESIVITNDGSRLSKSEIERMLNEAKEFEAQDRAKRSSLEAKQKFESYLYAARNSAREQKNPVVMNNVIKIEQVVQEALQWIQEHPNDTEEMYQQQQKHWEQLINPLFTVLGDEPKELKLSPIEIGGGGDDDNINDKNKHINAWGLSENPEEEGYNNKSNHFAEGRDFTRRGK